jgi:hypothetical protein
LCPLPLEGVKRFKAEGSSKVDIKRKGILFISAVLFISGLSATAFYYTKGKESSPGERPVKVVQVTPSGSEAWLLPTQVLIEKTPDSKGFLFQVINLRARKVPVQLLDYSETVVRIKKEAFPSGAFIIADAQGLKENEPVIPVAGIEDTQLIRLVLEAGVAAIEKEDLHESLRFLSQRYQDPWGYNSKIIKALLKRAFKEFDRPRVEIILNPSIRITGKQAMVQTGIRLKAMYRGRSNFLLGDSKGPNKILIALEKETSGWKLVQITGLNPLGFDEKFLKLIGGDIGLPLNKSEQQERQEACMPCRERMNVRFGKSDRK